MGYDGYGGGYGEYDDSGMRKIKEERGYDGYYDNGSYD